MRIQLKTVYWNEVLEMVKITIQEIPGEEQGGLTIDVDELPVLGEGKNREEAIKGLLDAVVLRSNCQEQDLMNVLLQCNGDTGEIRKILGL